MLHNYVLVAVLITIAWVALIGVYMFYSRQQSQLEQELVELQQMLDRSPGQENQA